MLVPVSISTNIFTTFLVKTPTTLSASFSAVQSKSASPKWQQSIQTASAEAVTVKGSNGQYTGQVSIDAPITTVWSVLTDYDNFEQFFPNISESKLIQSQDNKKVFEQQYQIRIAGFSRQFRVQVEAQETYPKAIKFQQVEGDLKTLEGEWEIQTLPSNSRSVVVTHRVTVMPVDTFTRGIFFSIYENTFKKTLFALKQEAEQR
ncbi:MAG: SRPBCC family protein [Microcoleaceae cyanobacterium]